MYLSPWIFYMYIDRGLSAHLHSLISLKQITVINTVTSTLGDPLLRNNSYLIVILISANTIVLQPPLILSNSPSHTNYLLPSTSCYYVTTVPSEALAHYQALLGIHCRGFIGILSTISRLTGPDRFVSSPVPNFETEPKYDFAVQSGLDCDTVRS